MRILSVENPRFPGEGSSALGKSGPKVRLKSVADGKKVNIPLPLKWRDGVTEEARSYLRMDVGERSRGYCVGKSAQC